MSFKIVPLDPNSRSTIIVCGYTRNLSIPIEIVAIIRKFYQFDIWSAIYQVGVGIYNKGHSFTVLKRSMVCSSNSVKSGMKYLWTVKILYFNKFSSKHNSKQPYIGIIKDNAKLITKYQEKWLYKQWDPNYNNAHTNYYGYVYQSRARDERFHIDTANNGYLFCCGSATLRPTDIKYGRKCVKNGSIIIINLDLIQNTLSYIINGIDYGIAFKNIVNCDYRLCVIMDKSAKGSKIALL